MHQELYALFDFVSQYIILQANTIPLLKLLLNVYTLSLKFVAITCVHDDYPHPPVFQSSTQTTPHFQSVQH